MRLKLAYYGDAILRKKCDPVEGIDNEMRQLIHDMVETMEAENGCGLAAPQVHKNLRLFITRAPIHYEETDSWNPGILRVFFNPVLSNPSEETWLYSEGCLSIPKVHGDIERPVAITIEATDLDGNKFKETFEGLEARIIMHENDHINGTLFPDRMTKSDRKKIQTALDEVKQKFSKK